MDKGTTTTTTTTTATATPSNDNGRLYPRVAVLLGVDRKWYIPLLICRALYTLPAAWWGLRCAFTFLAELLQIRMMRSQGLLQGQGWPAAIVESIGAEDWDVERRFRVTEVALAIMWVSLSQNLWENGWDGIDFYTIVQCICISILFLCGLYDVQMVCPSSSSSSSTLY